MYISYHISCGKEQNQPFYMCEIFIKYLLYYLFEQNEIESEDKIQSGIVK